MIENYEENRRLKRKHKAIEVISDEKAKKVKLTKIKCENNPLLPMFRDTDTSNI